jgi:hypothetical protein
MLPDLPIYQLPKMPPEASVSALLIHTHETPSSPPHQRQRMAASLRSTRSVDKAVLPNCVGRMVIGSRQLI